MNSLKRKRELSRIKRKRELNSLKRKRELSRIKRKRELNCLKRKRELTMNQNQEVAHRQDDTVGKWELILTRSQALKRGLKLVDLAGGNVKVVNSGEDHQSTDDDGDDISSLSRSYFLDACYTANLPSDPTSLRDALESPQSKEWKKALNEGYQSLVENNTWTLVPASSVPKDRKPLTNKVVFKTKYNADGTIAK